MERMRSGRFASAGAGDTRSRSGNKSFLSYRSNYSSNSRFLSSSTKPKQFPAMETSRRLLPKVCEEDRGYPLSAVQGCKQQQQGQRQGNRDGHGGGGEEGVTRRVSAALLACVSTLVGNNKNPSSSALAKEPTTSSTSSPSASTASLSTRRAMAKATSSGVLTTGSGGGGLKSFAGFGVAAGAAASMFSLKNISAGESQKKDQSKSSKNKMKINKRTANAALPAPKAIMNEEESAPPEEGESLSFAAAAAAAEAAKAAGHATALAALTQVVEDSNTNGSTQGVGNGDGGGSDVLALDEVRSCVSAALESSSEQTKLAVLDLAETLLNRLKKKDEEIEELQARMVTSKEVTQSVKEIRESTNRKLSELFGDMDTLRAKLKEIVGERDTLRDRVKSLERMEVEEVPAFQEELERVRESRNRLEEELKVAREKTIDREETEDLIEGLRKDLSEALSESKSLRDRVSALEQVEEELSTFKTKLSEAESTLSNLKDDLRERETQSDELARENEVMKEKVSAMEEEAGKSESEDVEQLLEENKALAASLEDMSRDASLVAELKEEVSSLKEDNSKLKIKADKGHELLFESNSSYNQLKESVDSLEKEKAEAVLQVEEGEERTREMQDQLKAKGEELEKALEMVSEMKEHLSETHERNQDLETTCARMKSELEASNNNLGLELKEREKEVLEMNELLKRLKASTDQVEELKGQLIQVKSDYATQQSLVQSKEQAQAELQSEVDDLRNQLEADDKPNTQDKEMLEELQKVQEELAQNKLTSTSKDSTIERLTLKVSQNEAMIQEMEKKSTSLEESNQEYEKLISQLEGNIQTLDTRMREDAEKMEELNQLTSKMTQYSSEAAEAENLREFIKEQKIQFQEQQQALKEEASAKEARARALTALITDLHSLATRLN